jgi:hypothetical protein
VRNTSLISLALLGLLLSGCSGKKYFEPEGTLSASSASTNYGGSIVDLRRDGATLKSGKYVGTEGVSTLNLGKGYRFLSESPRYVLASSTEGVLNIIDKKTKESHRAISLHTPVVSATIKNGIVAYVLNNNAFGIYKIASNKKLIESRSGKTYAIDTRAASPMFVDNLVVMPMLDGKLIIVNAKDTDSRKVVYVSSEKYFNNIIHLSRRDNTMIAATPTKIITLGTNGKQEFNANISEVAVDANRIYIFTKEGKITALNKSLKNVAQAKYRYAHYAVAVAQNGRVYALDQQGSLIVTNKGLDKQKIYDLGEVKEPAFITGSKLYKDGKVIELSNLGYE